MKELLIYRHAHTLPAERGQVDHDRTLSERGSEQCVQMGEWLKDKAWPVGRVLCSTSARTRQTLEETAKAASQNWPADFDDRLYLASAGEIFRVINKADDASTSMMIVGHNPGLHQFCTVLGQDDVGFMEHYAYSFPTGTLIRFGLAIDTWDALDPNTQSQVLDFHSPGK